MQAHCIPTAGARTDKYVVMLRMSASAERMAWYLIYFAGGLNRDREPRKVVKADYLLEL
jgi:hypothetical protein